MAMMLGLMPLAGLAQDAPPADCSEADIPDVPFAGRIGGDGFSMTDAGIHPNGTTGINDVDYDAYQLVIGTSNAAGQRAEVWVGIIVEPGTVPDGRMYRMLPQDAVSGQPEAGPGAPEVQGWFLESQDLGIEASFVFDVASLRLELGERNGSALPGRLYFCAPDIEQSSFAGTFEATVDE